MENKNVLLAIVLSAAILIVWTVFVQGPQLEKQQAAQQAQLEAQKSQQPGQPAAAPQDTGRKVVSREDALTESPRVAIDTPRLKGSINLKGARLDDLVLKDYRETVDPTSPNIVLLSPANTEHGYFSDLGWLDAGNKIAMPGSETIWQADATELKPGQPVTLTWDNGQGLTFTRKFELDADYMFTVTESVANNATAPVELIQYGRTKRYGTPKGASQSYVLHEGPLGVFDGTLKEESYGAVHSNGVDEDPPFTYTSTGGWLGMSDKYWLVAQIPPQDEVLDAKFYYDPKGDFYQVEFASAKQQIPAGGSITRTQHVFAGAKVVKMLDAYSETVNVPLFDRAIDFGWFYFLTRPLFYLLDLIYTFVGNFGIAILCLTVLVKGVMFPLANKSYRSMSKMKILGPKMQELKEKYGDDRAKLNQEMMAMYKREKVNPAAGCLPIVVQIPVFYALYKVIYVTIEMRHAPFFGWIHDLSAPDPTSILNLFGLIPWDYHVLFTIPLLGALVHFLSIGVWPLIMGFTMWAQMRLNPTPPDPVQARIFALMPIIFTFMLAPFSAGLVIYWAWNNTLSIAQQRLIMWRMGVKT
jgi:YidC/Oxa1 family membrane protein insertase